MFGSTSQAKKADKAAADADKAARVAAEKALAAESAQASAQEEVRAQRRAEREAALAQAKLEAKARLTDARGTASEAAHGAAEQVSARASQLRGSLKDIDTHELRNRTSAGYDATKAGLLGVIASALAASHEASAGARERSAHAAGSAMHWAEPHLGKVREQGGAQYEKVRPHVEKARERGLDAAAPRVESAAKALQPKVDLAHDRIVDDVLPRIVEAVNAAADAASAKADEAAVASKSGLAELAKVAHAETPAVQKRRSGGRTVLLLGALGAGAAAAYAAWKSTQPTEDPWAVATAATTPANPPAPPTRPAGTSATPPSSSGPSTSPLRPASTSPVSTDKASGESPSSAPSPSTGSSSARAEAEGDAEGKSEPSSITGPVAAAAAVGLTGVVAAAADDHVDEHDPGLAIEDSPTSGEPIEPAVSGETAAVSDGSGFASTDNLRPASAGAVDDGYAGVEQGGAADVDGQVSFDDATSFDDVSFEEEDPDDLAYSDTAPAVDDATTTSTFEFGSGTTESAGPGSTGPGMTFTRPSRDELAEDAADDDTVVLGARGAGDGVVGDAGVAGVPDTDDEIVEGEGFRAEEEYVAEEPAPDGSAANRFDVADEEPVDETADGFGSEVGRDLAADARELDDVADDTTSSGGSTPGQTGWFSVGSGYSGGDAGVGSSGTFTYDGYRSPDLSGEDRAPVQARQEEGVKEFVFGQDLNADNRPDAVVGNDDAVLDETAERGEGNDERFRNLRAQDIFPSDR